MHSCTRRECGCDHMNSLFDQHTKGRRKFASSAKLCFRRLAHCCVCGASSGARLSGLAAQQLLSHGSGSPGGSARALSSKQSRWCCSCCENSDATTTTSLPTFWCASKAAPAPCCTQFRLHMPIHQASPTRSLDRSRCCVELAAQRKRIELALLTRAHSRTRSHGHMHAY